MTTEDEVVAYDPTKGFSDEVNRRVTALPLDDAAGTVVFGDRREVKNGRTARTLP